MENGKQKEIKKKCIETARFSLTQEYKNMLKKIARSDGRRQNFILEQGLKIILAIHNSGLGFSDVAIKKIINLIKKNERI